MTGDKLKRDDMCAVQPPKVSVVMAVYNGERYLRQAVDSILAQTWTDLEYVIVNDGSSDSTMHILDNYSDPRIVRVNNDCNLGLTRSLNRGIAVAQGELIARQDADDASFPERLARQIAYLDSHPAVGLVGTWSRWIANDGSVIHESRPPSDPAVLQANLLWSVPFLHGTFMLRRVCLTDLGGGYREDVPVAQDCDLLLRLADRWDLANVPEMLYTYRLHDDTVTSRRRGDQQYYLRKARELAIRRRLAYGKSRIGLGDKQSPLWIRQAPRPWLARRFAWWAKGTLASHKAFAFEFWCIAFLLEPTTPEIWQYVVEALSRKARSIVRRHIVATKNE